MMAFCALFGTGWFKSATNSASWASRDDSFGVCGEANREAAGSADTLPALGAAPAFKGTSGRTIDAVVMVLPESRASTPEDEQPDSKMQADSRRRRGVRTRDPFRDELATN